MFGALGTALGGPILGGIGSVIGGLFGNEFQSDEATAARDWSAGEAEKNRQWQMMMSNTAYQRQVEDMKAAGLNPMLAAMKGGGATTPSGGVGSPSSAGHSNDLTGGVSATTAAQIEVLQSQAEKNRADAENVKAQTPTHAVNIDRMNQDIRESVQRIENLQVQMKVGTATAANLEQQTRNLTETVEQIRASTQQLKDLAYLNMAQAVETLTRSGLNEAHAKEVIQRVKQNLPAIERELMILERTALQMSQPGQMANEAAQSSFVGQLGAYMRALLPVQGILGSIPTGPRTIVNKSEPRITVKP